MNRIFVGVDNGVSGSVGIIGGTTNPLMFPIPTKSEQDYIKARRNITRVDSPALKRLLRPNEIEWGVPKLDWGEFVTVVIERPMVNPGRFRATVSALRCLEAVLVVVETLRYRRMYVDSREWQKQLLPKGTEGPDLKTASADIGKRLFPSLAKQIDKHGDADGLLIAEFARRGRL